MSRTQPRSKQQYRNYLNLSNNCKIVSKGQKPLPHLNPQNILTDNIRQVWLSNELPAVCIIDMRNAVQKPIAFNRVGFHCWHQYQSNPKLIEIQYTGQDNPENAVWVVLTKIRLQLISGWQHFKIPTLPAKNLSFLKLKIMQNHSDLSRQYDHDVEPSHYQSNTYLNQVSLGYVEDIIQSRVQITALNTNSREKTFSDFRKPNFSQKQIKKLTQKVNNLTTENQVMKRTITHQSNIILKLQNAMETLTQNIAKLQKIQSLQQQKIKKLQKNTPLNGNHYQQSHQKQKLQQFFNDESQIIQKNEEKSYSRQRQQKRNFLRLDQNQSQPSKHNSVYKSKAKSNQKSNYSNKRQVINANINESQNSLSEYQGVVDQRNYGRMKGQKSQGKQKTYIPMLQKLQQLIMLRDEKKHRLKTNKKGRRQDNVIIDSDPDGSSND